MSFFYALSDFLMIHATRCFNEKNVLVFIFVRGLIFSFFTTFMG